MEKKYFNGGCFDCMFARRDERRRFVAPCDGYSNCSWKKFEGEVDPLTEEEKDQCIAELEEKQMQVASEKDFLKSERDNLERSLEEACDRITELEEENSALQKNFIEMVKKEVEENYFDLLKDLQLYKDDNAKLETKINQISEEFNKQHELLDQYELECTDEIVRLKNQKIAELEAKLEEVEGQYAYECECNKQLVELQEENAKLQEQLKNAFCPKYRLGEEKWYVEENGYCNYEVQVFSGTINEISISDWGEGPILYYKFDTSARYILEEEIFSTEAEAQKYLEEHK